jgi:ketosteroid isomerase-like protein
MTATTPVAPTHSESATDLITRFETRFNTREFDAIMADMTDDCVFEHIGAEGHSFGRHEGQEAVRAVWHGLEEVFPGYRFELEDVFAAGSRGACRWIVYWTQPDGTSASLRGADIFTIRDGKIAEKITYTA